MIDWVSLAKVVAVGLVFGAGLPALFALGVRSLAGPGSKAEAGGRVPWRVALAIVCFAVVVAAVVAGVIVITGH